MEEELRETDNEKETNGNCKGKYIDGQSDADNREKGSRNVVYGSVDKGLESRDARLDDHVGDVGGAESGDGESTSRSWLWLKHVRKIVVEECEAIRTKEKKWDVFMTRTRLKKNSSFVEIVKWGVPVRRTLSTIKSRRWDSPMWRGKLGSFY